VIVIVIVIDPVIVAALVNGNDIVVVIDAVDDQGSIWPSPDLMDRVAEVLLSHEARPPRVIRRAR
jgi:hypothetical protein